MSFISLRNTPLDVYFLADVSASLSNTIQSLREGIVTIGKSEALILVLLLIILIKFYCLRFFPLVVGVH